jgi:hypothetical protein
MKKYLNITHPELLLIWDYDKNIISPTEITFGSHKKVFWKCLINDTHSYELTINSKTNNKNGCPQCSGAKVSNSNSLSVNYPEILNEWNYELNIILPSEISFSSHKKIWLYCQNNIHESYLTTPNARITNKRKCSLCASNLPNQKLLKLNNDKFNGRNWVPYIVKQKRGSAKQKGHKWQLLDLDCAQLILRPCYYCTRFFDKKMGIDRVDNSKEYIINNCVPCCKFCNTAKLNLTINEFKLWINGNQSNIDNKSTYSNYKNNASKRNIQFELTKEQYKYIIRNNCYYCNGSGNMGIDRLDNNLPYLISNCVSSCKICNRAKLTQSINDFINMRRLLQFNINNFS